MPIRMLRDWTDSTALENVSAEGERLFVRLIMKADDYGRFHGDPRLIRALCFPLMESIKVEAVRKWTDELHKSELLVKYTAESKDLLAIVNFGQRLKKSRAKFPQLPGENADWKPTSGNFRELPASSGLNRIEHEEEEERKAPAADLFSCMSEQRRGAFEEWLKYKSERGQKYKPTGLKNLIAEHGRKTDAELAEAVRYSMANNYAGIFPPPKAAHINGTPTQPVPQRLN